jgi:uncharacterized protein (DUF736 family)
MAVEQWQKPLPQMREEAIGALAALASGRQQAAGPLRETAALVTVAAHQVPALVEAGAFRHGDLDAEELRAMVVVVDVAAAWDHASQDLRSYIASLPEPALQRLAEASSLWARAVWKGMVPLPAEEKARILWSQGH